MKVNILATQNTPADRAIEYLRQQLEAAQMPVQVIDADSREGIALCGLYDLMNRPAVVVIDGAGSFIQSWQGELPSFNEVQTYYGMDA